ncbi:hypothetical protein Y1Q_0003767 [Alligator mississippiensis]|uniref:Uncharacterized protein n=1 Tax=Alligator mississippiensis TaxID=8496 RepID=A0A151MN65_ALLMI|nr:hypothetical protein Y1Q_0003767 [Alligator mississippiensis]
MSRSDAIRTIPKQCTYTTRSCLFVQVKHLFGIQLYKCGFFLFLMFREQGHKIFKWSFLSAQSFTQENLYRL